MPVDSSAHNEAAFSPSNGKHSQKRVDSMHARKTWVLVAVGGSVLVLLAAFASEGRMMLVDEVTARTSNFDEHTSSQDEGGDKIEDFDENRGGEVYYGTSPGDFQETKDLDQDDVAHENPSHTNETAVISMKQNPSPSPNQDEDNSVDEGGKEDMKSSEIEKALRKGFLPSSLIRKLYLPPDDEMKAAWNRAKKETAALRRRDVEFPLFLESYADKKRLVYIKMHKVGGTSVAKALERAAHDHGLREMRSRERKVCRHGDTEDETASLFDIWFSHSKKSEWMETCLPNAIYASVLREPVSRTVSLLTWYSNREYFIKYPARECSYKGPFPDPEPVDPPYSCHDDEFRKKLLKKKLISKLEKKSLEKECHEPCRYIASTDDPLAAYEYTKQHFGLVGTTERLDAFIVLLALRFDWSIETVFYERCKVQYGAQPGVSDLKDHPWAIQKLNEISEEDKLLYSHIKQDFEAYLARLGPGFTKVLEIYKKGLKKYHDDISSARGKTYKRWISENGRGMFC